MGLFGKKLRKKNTKTIEEQNKENEKSWNKLGLDTPEAFRNKIAWDQLQKEIKEFRKANVDEEYIRNYLYSHLPDGRIKLDGKLVYICRSCETGRKFDTKMDYIAHQMSVHS